MLQARLNGFDLMRSLCHQRFQPLSVLCVVDGGATGSFLISEATKAVSLPGIKPASNRVTPDCEYFADLVDGVAIVAEQNAMGSTAQGRLIPALMRIAEGLGFGRGKGLHKSH